MHTHADKTHENKSQSGNKSIQKKKNSESASQFEDKSLKATAQREAQKIADNSPKSKQTAQLVAQNPSNLNSNHAPVQRIRAKLGVDAEKYKALLRSTVYLYAELDGTPVGENGIFKSDNKGHAEDSLIRALNEAGATQGSLVVYLSTSPCSSTFGTRDDGNDGCQEKLESLNGLGFKVNVKADHLYQPQAIGEAERDSSWPTGFSSYSAAATSGFGITLSHLPKNFQDNKLQDNGSVAQLARKKAE